MSSTNQTENKSTAPPAAAGRDWLLRMILFSGALGTVLSLVYSRFLASFGPSDEIGRIPASSYHHVIVPLCSVAAAVGVLILEKQPGLGLFLTMVSVVTGIKGGTIYLLPALILCCIWAVRHSYSARVMLGFMLLIPGVAGTYFGVAELIVYYGGSPLQGLPLDWVPPANVWYAVEPFLLLPLALFGAWLLIARQNEGRPV